MDFYSLVSDYKKIETLIFSQSYIYVFAGALKLQIANYFNVQLRVR